MDRILTLAEVSQILKCSPWTLYKMLHKGEIMGDYKIGNQWRFKETTINSWLEEHRIGLL
jgi:excisionase family DNA binding protein